MDGNELGKGGIEEILAPETQQGKHSTRCHGNVSNIDSWKRAHEA